MWLRKLLVDGGNLELQCFYLCLHGDYFVFLFPLLFMGELVAIGIMGMSVDAAIQGVLVTGAAMLVNQGIKQAVKRVNDTGDTMLERELWPLLFYALTCG